MRALSPWAVSASAELSANTKAIFEQMAATFYFKVIATADSIWIQTELPTGGNVSFRAAPKFFSLYPLNDAPYTAVYEEQEVFCAFHDYLKHAEEIKILPSVKLLMAEYIRYLIDRSAFYYPTMLPKDMLEENPKIGEVDPKLWIALEDLQDGWLKSGTVGQEVYGAGNAFGILPRHYLQIPGAAFMVYTDYPTSGFTAQKGKNITFKILGDEQISCRMMLVKTAQKKIPEFKVSIKGQKEPLKASLVSNGNLEYIIRGNSQVSIQLHS